MLEENIKEIYGNDITIKDKKHAIGGCINRCDVLTLSDGLKIFVKENSFDLFSSEAEGLKALASAKSSLRVPKVIDVIKSEDKNYLLLEYIQQGEKDKKFFEAFGRSLAMLHSENSAPHCGGGVNNFLGTTIQDNSVTDSWYDFFGEQRLIAQVRMAEKAGFADKTLVANVISIASRLDKYIPKVEHFSLLHGDLWGGNYMVDKNCNAVLIDPAVYYGHNETDLAMTELFGGFSPEFYDAYKEILPVDEGYILRKELYNLYHLLNHLNMFGRHYVGNCRKIVKKFM